jgi:hypothetical protein
MSERMMTKLGGRKSVRVSIRMSDMKISIWSARNIIIAAICGFGVI